MIHREPPPWNKDASQLLRQFLETPVGEVFVSHVAAYRPTLISGGTDLTAVALKAAEVAGYERAFNYLLSLAEPPVEEAVSPEQYPPLDNESSWTEQKPT